MEVDTGELSVPAKDLSLKSLEEVEFGLGPKASTDASQFGITRWKVRSYGSSRQQRYLGFDVCAWQSTGHVQWSRGGRSTIRREI